MILIDDIIKYVNGKRAIKKYDEYFKSLLSEYDYDDAAKIMYDYELSLYKKINDFMRFNKFSLREIYDIISSAPEFAEYRKMGFEWPSFRAFESWRERFSAHLKKYTTGDDSSIRIIEKLAERVKDKIVGYPIFSMKPKKSKKYKNEFDMFVEFSDWQLGAYFTKRDLSNIVDNEYNYDIFVERLSTWVDKTIFTLNLYSNTDINIKTLVLNCLGDMVEGELIFATQGRFIDRSAFNQVMDGSRLFTDAFYHVIAEYKKLYPNGKIVFNGVFGNHGRLTKYHDPRDNFDLFVYKFMETALSGVIDEFNISEGVYPVLQYKDSFDNLHVMTHGNEVRNWGTASLPYYGMDKKFARYTDLIDTKINYWHLGHHHTVAIVNDGRIIVNGTPMGVTPYALKIGAHLIKPSQTISIFSKNGLENLHILLL